MSKIKINITILVSLFILNSCSLLGVQNEESPKYKVLVKKGDFEIREYAPYILAQTTVKGDFNNSSSNAFKILAGYIFGKNKSKKSISMTSPVKMKQVSTKIAMTSPVKMTQGGGTYTMSFSMPSKYTMTELPEPLDDRIKFKQVKTKIVATHEYSWFSSQEKNDKKAKELRSWLKEFKQYEVVEDYSYAGYNPPWTIPFLRRNEVHIELREKKNQRLTYIVDLIDVELDRPGGSILIGSHIIGE